MANEVKISLKIDGLQVAKESLKDVTTSVKQVDKGTKDTDTNLKKVNTTASKTSTTFKGFSGILGSIGNSIKGIGSSVFSLQGAATAFVSAFAAGKVISAANTQEDAINALNVALKGAGDFSREASEDFQVFASELQSVSTFGDESTLQMIAFAKSLGVANDQTKELIRAAADASAATGRDFRTSVEGLIQTLSGTPGTFARVVPAIRSLTKEQLKAGEGIRLVANLFEGAAKGQLNTFRGALTQSTNAFGDLLEEVGFLITKNPAVIAAVKETQSIFENLGTTVKDNREALIDLVVRGVNFSISAIAGLVRSINILLSVLDGVKLSINLAFAGISAIFSQIVEDIALVVNAFDKLFQAIGQGNFLTALTDQAEVFFSFFLNGLSKVADTWANILASFGENAVTDALDQASVSIRIFSKEIEASNDQARAFAEGNSQAIGGLAGEVLTLSQQIGDFGDISVEAAENGADSISSYGKIFEEIASTIEQKGTAAISEVAKAQKDLLNSFANAPKEFGLFEAISNIDFTPIKDNFEAAVKDPFTTLSNAIPKEFFDDLKSQIEGAFGDAKFDPKEIEVEISSTLQATGLLLGFSKTLQSGSKAFLQTLSKGVGQLATAIVGPLGPILGDAIAQIIDVFGQAPEEFQKAIVDTIKGIPQIIANVIINIARLAGGSFASEAINGFISNLPEVTKALSVSLSTQLASPAFWTDVALSAIGAFIGAIPEMIQGFIDGFRDGIKDLFSIFGDLSDFLSDAFGSLKEVFGNILGPVADSIKDLFKDIFGSLKDAFSSLFNLDFSGIFDAFKGLGSIVLDIFKKPFEILSGLFKKIFKFDGGGKGTVENFLGFDFPFIKFSEGGVVPGKAKASGDSTKNDIIPALLSPGEIVLPRSVVNKGIPAIKSFLDAIDPNALSQFGVVPKVGQVQKFLFGSIGNFFEGLIEEGKAGIESLAPIAFSAVTGGYGLFDTVGGGLTGIAQDLVNLLPSDIGQQVNDFANLINEGIFQVANPDFLREIFAIITSLGGQLDWIKFILDPVSEAKRAVKGIALNSFGGLFKNLLGSPLQNGGTVPAGFPNDSFPARLTSGELVVPRDTVSQLQNFLDRETPQASNITDALLVRVINLLERPMSASANVEFNERAFADILLTLNRNNARTTA